MPVRPPPLSNASGAPLSPRRTQFGAVGDAPGPQQQQQPPPPQQPPRLRPSTTGAQPNSSGFSLFAAGSLPPALRSNNSVFNRQQQQQQQQPATARAPGTAGPAELLRESMLLTAPHAESAARVHTARSMRAQQLQQTKSAFSARASSASFRRGGKGSSRNGSLDGGDTQLSLSGALSASSGPNSTLGASKRGFLLAQQAAMDDPRLFGATVASMGSTSQYVVAADEIGGGNGVGLVFTTKPQGRRVSPPQPFSAASGAALPLPPRNVPGTASGRFLLGVGGAAGAGFAAASLQAQELQQPRNRRLVEQHQRAAAEAEQLAAEEALRQQQREEAAAAAEEEEADDELVVATNADGERQQRLSAVAAAHGVPPLLQTSSTTATRQRPAASALPSRSIAGGSVAGVHGIGSVRAGDFIVDETPQRKRELLEDRLQASRAPPPPPPTVPAASVNVNTDAHAVPQASSSRPSTATNRAAASNSNNSGNRHVSLFSGQSVLQSDLLNKPHQGAATSALLNSPPLPPRPRTSGHSGHSGAGINSPTSPEERQQRAAAAAGLVSGFQQHQMQVQQHRFLVSSDPTGASPQQEPLVPYQAATAAEIDPRSPGVLESTQHNNTNSGGSAFSATQALLMRSPPTSPRLAAQQPPASLRQQQQQQQQQQPRQTQQQQHQQRMNDLFAPTLADRVEQLLPSEHTPRSLRPQSAKKLSELYAALPGGPEEELAMLAAAAGKRGAAGLRPSSARTANKGNGVADASNTAASARLPQQQQPQQHHATATATAHGGGAAAAAASSGASAAAAATGSNNVPVAAMPSSSGGGVSSLFSAQHQQQPSTGARSSPGGRKSRESPNRGGRRSNDARSSSSPTQQQQQQMLQPQQRPTQHETLQNSLMAGSGILRLSDPPKPVGQGRVVMHEWVPSVAAPADPASPAPPPGMPGARRPLPPVVPVGSGSAGPPGSSDAPGVAPAFGKRLSPAEALAQHEKRLTRYEKMEILEYDDIYFVGAPGANKIPAPIDGAINYGYDDDRGEYNTVNGDHIAFRYEIKDLLGRGSFGQVLKVFDHKRQQFCALKIIRNKKRFLHQAQVEIKVLDHLRTADVEEKSCTVKMLNYFQFRSHVVITFEMHALNLYELTKLNKHQAFPMQLIRRFAAQLLVCLAFLHREKIMHADLKPENILLRQENKTGIRVIDFGSSCYEGDATYQYIQSRFYRAPEVILHIPYGRPMDAWSLGCILAEMQLGYPLFAGENEKEQMQCFMEVLGVPPLRMIERSPRRADFFDAASNNNAPKLAPNRNGKIRRPGSTNLRTVLGTTDDLFVDFVAGFLRWDPDERCTPMKGMEHPWISELFATTTTNTATGLPTGGGAPRPPTASSSSAAAAAARR